MTSETRPIEFALLGIEPEPWTLQDMFLGASFITWSLTGDFDDLIRLWLRDHVQNDTMYEDLYPTLMPYLSYVVSEQTDLNLEDYPDAPGGYPATPAQSTGEEAEPAAIAEGKLEGLLAAILPVVDPFGLKGQFGSNNWAVSGSRTATGSPLLCNDPHMPLTVPNLVYEAHLSVPDELNVMGVTLPGLPSVEAGFNDYIAWGFTNGGHDVLDIFAEELNPQNSSEYYYNGDYRAFEVIDETIETKEGVSIPFQVRASVHGPLIDEVVRESTGTPSQLAMNWTGNSVSHLIMAATQFDKAENMDEFFDSIYWWDNPIFNFAYADDEGNIAMTVCGRIPIRSGYSGLYPVIAVNDSVGMVGNVPFAHLPREVNPSKGYISSANQRSIDPAEYNYTLVGPFVDGYRGRRINELLAADENVTMEDMMRFQADALEIRARSIVPEVVAAWKKLGENNETVDALVSYLEEWDYYMDTDVEAPTIWLHLLNALQEETFDELLFLEEDLESTPQKSIALPSSRFPRSPILEQLVLENSSSFFDDTRTPDVIETRNDILVRALHQATDVMHDTYGSDTTNWLYGLHHVINIDHMAGLTTIEGGPHRGQHTLMPAHGWKPQSGPVWRLVADLSNPGNCRGVIPGGQSGNPFSSHFEDIFKLWYDFDSESRHYQYQSLLFYGTPEAFKLADTDGTLIERIITLNPPVALI
jgi:penicillin amidase